MLSTHRQHTRGKQQNSSRVQWMMCLTAMIASLSTGVQALAILREPCLGRRTGTATMSSATASSLPLGVMGARHWWRGSVTRCEPSCLVLRAGIVMFERRACSPLRLTLASHANGTIKCELVRQGTTAFTPVSILCVSRYARHQHDRIAYIHMRGTIRRE